MNTFCVAIEQSGHSFVVFAELVGEVGRYYIKVTDGKTVWVKKMSDEDIQNDNYVTKLRNGLLGEVSLSLETASPNVILTVGKEPSTTLEIEAKPSTADSLTDLLFAMAKHSADQAKELDRLTKEVSRLHSSSCSATGTNSNLVRLSNDFLARSKVATPTKVRRQPGMSVINPNSRKRKTGKGIEFQ